MTAKIIDLDAERRKRRPVNGIEVVEVMSADELLAYFQRVCVEFDASLYGEQSADEPEGAA